MATGKRGAWVGGRHLVVLAVMTSWIVGGCLGPTIYDPVELKAAPSRLAATLVVDQTGEDGPDGLDVALVEAMKQANTGNMVLPRRMAGQGIPPPAVAVAPFGYGNWTAVEATRELCSSAWVP